MIKNLAIHKVGHYKKGNFESKLAYPIPNIVNPTNNTIPIFIWELLKTIYQKEINFKTDPFFSFIKLIFSLIQPLLNSINCDYLISPKKLQKRENRIMVFAKYEILIVQDFVIKGPNLSKKCAWPSDPAPSPERLKKTYFEQKGLRRGWRNFKCPFLVRSVFLLI